MLAAWPAFADTPADSGELGEIVVTAQRRSERLQDVPMSIQAFSQQSLDQEGVRSVDDLTRVAPGVTFIRNGMSSSGNYNDEDSDISIRGIDSNAGSSTTGIYVDDTPIQTRHLNFGTVNPIPLCSTSTGSRYSRVRRAPCSAQDRRAAPSASSRRSRALPLTRATPGLSTARSTTAATVIRPVPPWRADHRRHLGFRVSASFQEDGGWVNRVTYNPPPSTVDPSTAVLYSGNPVITGTTEKNANWRDTQTFRAALKWQPIDGLSIEPSLYVQTLHINDTGAYWLNISNPAGTSTTTATRSATRAPIPGIWARSK